LTQARIIMARNDIPLEQQQQQDPSDEVDDGQEQPTQEQDDDVLWGSAGEGYTPLTDLLASAHTNGDGGVMVTFGPPPTSATTNDYDNDDDDDGYDSDSDDIDGSGIGNNNYHQHHFQYHQGAFFVNPAAFGPTNHSDDEDEGSDQQDTTGALPRATGVASTGAPPIANDIDFLALANQALSSLDDEYQSTVRGGHHPPRLEEEEQNQPPAPVLGVPMNTAIGHDDDDNWKNLVAVAIDDNLEQRRKVEFHAEWEQAPKVEPAATAAAAEVVTTTKDLPHVDTVAIQRAIQTIASQSESSPFQQKFLQWQERQKQQLETTTQPFHDLIPPKAIQASHILSRSATIAEALVRLGIGASTSVPSSILPKGTGNTTHSTDSHATAVTIPRTLTIHVIGVDHVECASVERIQATFRPLIQWIVMLQKNAPGSSTPPPSMFSLALLEQLHLVLVGRDLVVPTIAPVDLLPSFAPKDSHDVSSAGSPRLLQSAFATCHNGVYHEWLQQQEIRDVVALSTSPPPLQKPHLPQPFSPPDLIVAFNAGIWGYREWEPTIDWLSRWTIATNLIATAYTLPEAQEDCEVLQTTTAAVQSGDGSDHDPPPQDNTTTSITPTTDTAVVGIDQASQTTRRRLPRGEMLWEPGRNPFGSKVIRDTQSRHYNPEIGKVHYHENGAWQAWRLGGPEDD
jgi:hypothetical protein